jgi:hypothetical protein
MLTARQLLPVLNAMPNTELRQLIAHAAGIHAGRDADNGEAIAEALDRVSARLRHLPRRAQR